MVSYIFIGLVVLSTLVAFADWRKAMFLVIVIGLLQDPVRKSTPGVSSLFVLSTLPIWFAVIVRMFMVDGKSISIFSREYFALTFQMRMFLLMLIPGGIVMLMRGLHVWTVVLLGAFGYMAPMFGIVIGFVFSLNVKHLLRFMTFYCFLVALMLSGTLLDYLNIFPDWQAIGTSAMKMVWIKYVSYGHTISLKAGFFRSPDIMGWHGSMMAMISLVLFFVNRTRIPRWTWLIFTVWGVICIVISGRYKMIAMPMVWGVSYAVIISLYQGIGRVIGFALLGVLLIVGMSMASNKIGLGGSDYMLYAKSPGSYAIERVQKHGLDAVIGTYNQSGFLGTGLGSATQGTRHTGVKFKKSWQEGGLSKIMAELGVGGVIFFILLCIRLFGALLSNIRGKLSRRDGMFDLRAGLLSIIVANGISFVVSAQIFSDLFVLSIISISVGFVLSGKALDVTKI